MEYASVSHSVTTRPLVGLPSGQSVSVAVHRYVGGAGPTVYLQATQHGIELNGPATLRRLHEVLAPGRLAGTVVVVPVVNPLAFDHRSYITPAAYDAQHPNLNRVWPGADDGSLQERMAAALWPLVATADVVVDLHTGTADMLEHVRHFRAAPEARELASVFGTAYRLTDSLDAPDTDERTDASDDAADAADNTVGDGVADDDLDGDTAGVDAADDDGAHPPKRDDGTPQGTLRAAATRAGIPAITVELANSRQVAHDAVETGLAGIRNVLAARSLLETEPDEPPAQTVLERDGGAVTATESGLFELEPAVGVGDAVESGEALGEIYSPSTFEALETVRAADDGVIYSLARESVVVAGERVAGIAARV